MAYPGQVGLFELNTLLRESQSVTTVSAREIAAADGVRCLLDSSKTSMTNVFCLGVSLSSQCLTHSSCMMLLEAVSMFAFRRLFSYSQFIKKLLSWV